MSEIIDKKWSLARIVSLFMGLIIITALSGCSNYDNHDHPELRSGEALFNHHCARCHGEDGTGLLIKQIPANILTKRGVMGIVNYVTTNVNPNRKMPVFRAMSYSEAAVIANRLLKLKQIYDEKPNEKKKYRKLMIEP